jgi:hypothetical protein
MVKTEYHLFPSLLFQFPNNRVQERCFNSENHWKLDLANRGLIQYFEVDDMNSCHGNVPFVVLFLKCDTLYINELWSSMSFFDKITQSALA